MRRLQWRAAERPYDYLVLMVGEVDRSSTIWRRAARDGASASADDEGLGGSGLLLARQCADAAQRAISFMSRSIAEGFPRDQVVVMGAPLPTMRRVDFLAARHPHLLDEELAIEDLLPAPFLFANRTVVAETFLTLRLNSFLERSARRAGFLYAEVTDDTADPATGLLDRFFLASKPDIHLHLERSLFFWRRAIHDAADGRLEWC